MQTCMTQSNSTSLTWAVGCWEAHRCDDALSRAYLAAVALLADAADLLSSRRYINFHAVEGQICALHPHRLAPADILQPCTSLRLKCCVRHR